ncbi:MAG: fibronectin type III-like domain-contianing protein [Ginsengibacter sp.]
MGKVNPSGKFPFTFPVALNESPAHNLNTFPGENLVTNYKEGILVGYRWYDTKKITPLFPFGYGLSYTNFDYAALHTGKKVYNFNETLTAFNETLTATIKIKNTGKLAGKETVQLYVSKASSAIERAEKELKAFKKVMIPAGGEVTVTLNIPVKDLAYYDEKSMKWVVEPGTYKLLAGTSSQDIRATETFNIIGDK